MTRRQRAQVVELLRCAADLMISDPNRWHVAITEAGFDWPIQLIAIDAENEVDSQACTIERRHHVLLEAAARVERMEWP